MSAEKVKYYQLSKWKAVNYYATSLFWLLPLIVICFVSFFDNGVSISRVEIVIFLVVLLPATIIDLYLGKRNLRYVHIPLTLTKNEVLEVLKSMAIWKNIEVIEEGNDNFLLRSRGVNPPYPIPTLAIAFTQIHIVLCDRSIAITSFFDKSTYRNIGGWFTAGARNRNIRSFLIALSERNLIDERYFSKHLVRNEWNLKNTSTRIFSYSLFIVIVILGINMYWNTIWLTLPIIVCTIGALFIYFDLKVLLQKKKELNIKEHPWNT